MTEPVLEVVGFTQTPLTPAFDWAPAVPPVGAAAPAPSSSGRTFIKEELAAIKPRHD